MIRSVLIASLALLTAGFGHFVGSCEPVLSPEPPDLSLVVKLRVPRDAKFAKFQDILGKVKERGATHITLRASKEGEGASAEVTAQPQMPSKRIAAVVRELLEGGITKIAVEVRK